MHGKQILCAPHEEDLTICRPQLHEVRAHKKSTWCGNAEEAVLLTGTAISCTGTPDFVPTHRGNSRLKPKNATRSVPEIKLRCIATPGAAHQRAPTCPSLIEGTREGVANTSATGRRLSAVRSHQQCTGRTVGYFNQIFVSLRQQGRPVGSTVMTRR